MNQKKFLLQEEEWFKKYCYQDPIYFYWWLDEKYYHAYQNRPRGDVDYSTFTYFDFPFGSTIDAESTDSVDFLGFSWAIKEICIPDTHPEYFL